MFISLPLLCENCLFLNNSEKLPMRLRSSFVKRTFDYSYLVKNNGFCASLRLSSKGTFFNETFSNISSKRSSVVSFCSLERSSSSSSDLLDFLTREPIGSTSGLELPKSMLCLCKILKLVISTVQQQTHVMD